MVIIYKVADLTNGKVYIGQTTQTLAKRWNDHCTHIMERCNPLSLAIREKGSDNFTIAEVDRASKEDAEQCETDWIAVYESDNPEKGYNVYSGQRARTKYDRAGILELHNQGMDVYEIAEELQAYHGTITIALKSLNIKPNRKSDHFFIAFSDSGMEINKFHSASCAANWLISLGKKASQSSVAKAVTREQRSGGYYWKKVSKLEYNSVKVQE